MADPKTWELLGAVESCMQQIQTANGYYTDAGSNVTRELFQVNEGDASELIIVAFDTLSQTAEPALRTIGREVGVLVVGKVKASRADAQLRLHQLVEDIQRALDGQQTRFPSGTSFPRFVEARPISPAEGMEWIGANVRFSAQVRRH